MNLTCPECKNQVDISTNSNLSVDNVVECDVCGVSLLVTEISGDNVRAEVVDEGK